MTGMQEQALVSAPLQRELQVLYDRHRANQGGEVASYIPALAAADPRWFGISVVTTDGHAYEVGDTRLPFTIQSISKPFVFGLAVEDQGLDAVLGKVGVEPSGEAFNSISLAAGTGRPRNPMINAGAIATTALVAGTSASERLARLLATLSDHAGRPLAVDPVVFESERETGHRNRAIGHLLRNFDVLTEDPESALDLYFQQCSVLVDCHDLAVMAACLANGGTNPLTGERALRPDVVAHVLSVMTTCGMYDYAGEWVFWVGMPAKSGVTGGILAVLPGQLGVGVFSPPLDERGNSVRGVQVCRDLAGALGLHFMRPARPVATAVRREYDLTKVASKRRRNGRERSWLDEAGTRACVYELAGDLGVPGIEVVAQRVTKAAAPLDAAVLDLTRVTRTDDVAARMLAHLVVALDRQGTSLAFAGGHRHARLIRQLEEILLNAERQIRVRTFPDADRALEWCETLVLRLRPEALDGPGAVPLRDHDFCADLTDDELAALERVLSPRAFAPGARLLRQGDASDGLYLLLQGDVSVSVDVPPGRRRRLATLSAGMTIGELALVDRGPRSADVYADTAATCLFLPLDAFDELSHSHPSIKIKLLQTLVRTAARMVARLNDELSTLEP
jgi:glutaminase